MLFAHENHLREGERVAVSDCHERSSAADRGESPGCATVQLQLRRPTPADHLDVTPHHSERMPRAERLHRRFFYGETAGEVGRGTATPEAVGDLVIGEDAVEEPVAIALDGARNTRDVGGVQPDSDDVGHHLYMLPELSRGFKWVPAAHGPALVCEALETCADHLFTTRLWTLGSTDDAERGPGWEEVAGAMGVSRPDLLRARQVHGAAVVVHRNGQQRGHRLEDADILVTDDSSIALAIQTADCVPLLIGDRRTGSVAAAHAGWRGLAARVPQVAVEALAREFGSRADDLVAAIGPSISAGRYEVGAEVRARFDRAGCTSTQLTRWFANAERPDHFYFDAWRAAHDQLIEAGLAAAGIHAASLCTASHPEVLCSYRRDGKGAGRIAAAIRALGSSRSHEGGTKTRN
jgi:polyphenol oxidase